MFRRSGSAMAKAGTAVDVIAEPKLERARRRLLLALGELAATHRLGMEVVRDPVAELAWLIRACSAGGQFADRFYVGVRSGLTAPQAAERLPIEVEEAP